VPPICHQNYFSEFHSSASNILEVRLSHFLSSETYLTITKLRFIRLIGKEHALVVVEDEISLKLFLDPINTISASIAKDGHKKRFYFEKIGHNHVFAVDETKRLFVLVASQPVSGQLII
jgi:hypothetical protein